MYVFTWWYLCMNAEGCLPTSRSIPSHQPYDTSSLERGPDIEDPKFRLTFVPREVTFSTI